MKYVKSISGIAFWWLIKDAFILKIEQNENSLFFYTQAKRAENLMKKAGKSNYQISIHEGAGHLIDLPFCPPSTLTKHPLFPKEILLQCGGEDTIKHGQAQERIWMELLTFFESNLTP